VRRAGQALLLQARLDLHRAVGAVRPDPLAGVGEIEHIVQLLTVVLGFSEMPLASISNERLEMCQTV
jgi:hypothetical protein